MTLRDYGPAVLPNGSLADWYQRSLRSRHFRKDHPVAHCASDRQNWPCDTIRALDAVASAEANIAVLYRNWTGDRDKLVAIRTLADQLGDRSGEPAALAPEVRVHLPVSDRRVVEPIRRMLLEILDGPA